MLAAERRTTFVLPVNQYLLRARDGPGTVVAKKQVHTQRYTQRRKLVAGLRWKPSSADSKTCVCGFFFSGFTFFSPWSWLHKSEDLLWKLRPREGTWLATITQQRLAPQPGLESPGLRAPARTCQVSAPVSSCVLRFGSVSLQHRLDRLRFSGKGPCGHLEDRTVSG